MKMIKMALLGGAALAVTAGVARADELADLKAQVESLNARVAQMEAAPSVPTGYSLLTVHEGEASVAPGLTREERASWAGPATVISVLPTADAPAAATIDWNGYARAILHYYNLDVKGAVYADEGDFYNVYARGRLNMNAKTDTSVGEVGVSLRIEGNGDGHGDLYTDMPVAWGWWAMTPELTLGGGYTGSLANIGFGYDGACTCAGIDAADVYANNGPGATSDTSQMRLTYASGPLSFAVAVEDAVSGGAFDGGNLGVAGELAYAGDTFSGEVSGMWRDTTDTVFVGADDTWAVGVGLGFNMDPVALSLAAGLGHTPAGGWAIPDNADYWYVNGLASMNLSDEIHMELGAGYKTYNPDMAALSDMDIMSVMGGLYYSPVSQLTIGLEAEYISTDNNHNFGGHDTEEVIVDLMTVYAF